MPILIVPAIVIITILHLVAAFVYFALALGVLEAFHGANFGYAFGLRVGFAASVVGAATGALLALEKYWDDIKWHDGSIAWVSRLLAVVACAAIIGVTVSNSGFEALGSLLHYRYPGLVSVIVFVYGSRLAVGLHS